ncbi:MAG: hypothetical protein AAB295_04325 [Chloroflexota bacterium]
MPDTVHLRGVAADQWPCLFYQRLVKLLPPHGTTRVLRGGYPEIMRRSQAARRASWFRSYVTTILQRDVRELTQVAQPQDMTRVLTMIGSRVGSPLKVMVRGALPGSSSHAVPISALWRL